MCDQFRDQICLLSSLTIPLRMELPIFSVYNIVMKKVVGLILGIPLMIALLNWIFSYLTHPTPGNAANVAPVIVEAATPWWASVFQVLATWGLLGGILIIAIVFLIVKNKLPEW